ncbi:N-acetylmuramoyl-L-alanine amidase [Affinibrenneria salicis]|uniref:N-acetylmuramoyl-L-alanine amidase n=1 Tax=Affinibrenneria salicis TaxID=2590031 RepID=A0A5J5G2J6_9GAMM|nr:N-acetylmuramoyl-L-alanine amidase [Affinibrenneria salicis]KAA9001069.1 N-acetylmuramoyl-L-alanine amidase [Affinibrenneria salicis]
MMRWSAGLLALLALAGCQSDSRLADRGSYLLNSAQQAKRQEARIRFLVIHYTAGDFPASLSVLTDEHVSVHYLIPAAPPRVAGKPVAWQLVPESEAAWHAGASYWRGYSRLNATSVGIELENAGYYATLTGWRGAPFPPAQIALLIDIAREIVARYHIAPVNVVAHSDIAPQRKQDPGPLFPWRALAQAGIGAWPDEQRVAQRLLGRRPDQPVATEALLSKLQRYGYEVDARMDERQRRRVIAAFQLHFRPGDHRGLADAETEAIADTLLEQYGAGG